MEGRTTIGRASDCDIQVLHEGVSRRHAKVTRDPDGHMTLVDLSSDNGTFVEGERITRHTLQVGEAIRIMRTRFTYEVIEEADVATSAVFHRKVTSGDSLRQTAKHRPTLGSMRAAGSSTSLRVPDRARPQAVAPAPSGARPGAAGMEAGRQEGPRTRAGTKEFSLSEQTRPSGDVPAYQAPAERGPGSETSGDYARDRWPDIGGSSESSGPSPSTAASTPSADELPAGSGASVNLGLAAPGSGAFARAGLRGAGDSEASGSGAYGWHAGEDTRRRERITPMPTASPVAAGATRSARAPAVARAEPSGRMAPAAPAGVAAEQPAAVEATPATVGPRRASGWTAPVGTSEVPGAMRPSGTLSGIPRVDDYDSALESQPSLLTKSEASPIPRRGATAEYGLVDDEVASVRKPEPVVATEAEPERAQDLPLDEAPEAAPEPSEASTPDDAPEPSTTPALAEQAALPEATPAADARPTPSSTSAEEDDESTSSRAMDAMDTLPTVRRAAPGEGARRAPPGPKRAAAFPAPTGAAIGSKTPTEEVPPIRGRGAATRRRGTEARLSGDMTGPAVAAPRAAHPTPHPEMEAPPVPRQPTMPISSSTQTPLPTPSPAPAPPLAATPSLPTKPKPPVAYEDTLRWHRPDPVVMARAEDAPEAREQVSSDELVAALEDLVSDEITAPMRLEVRPDARKHESASVDAPDVAELLDQGELELPMPQGEPLSEADRVELRAQHLIEHAEQEHRRKVGLGILVDILEYRELRLRSLRGDRLASEAKERYASLEERLQQHLPEDDDEAAMRRYHRFVCSIPAQLTHQDGGVVSTVSVEVEDISAGGAKVTFGECSLGMGQTVWLSVDLLDSDRRRMVEPDATTVVFQARVVWARDHDAELGLIFAGAPRYDEAAVVRVET